MDWCLGFEEEYIYCNLSVAFKLFGFIAGIWRMKSE